MLLTLALLAIPAGHTASGTNAPNDTHMTQDSVMTAKALYDEFKTDAEAATRKYGGKMMTVTEFVVYTGPDVYALPSVELSERRGGKSRMLCVLPFSDYLKLRKVSKGDGVRIRGQVRGFYEKGDQVLLKQCEILEDPVQ